MKGHKPPLRTDKQRHRFGIKCERVADAMVNADVAVSNWERGRARRFALTALRRLTALLKEL